MFRVAACLLEDHDLRLVFVAAVVCILSWSGAVLVLDRIRAAPERLRHAWQFLAAMAAGGGTWATHFMGMLAYDPGIAIGFDLSITLFSFVIAVCGAWAAFTIAGFMKGAASRIVAGLVMGATVAGLHYVGLWAIHAAATRVWAFDLVAASVFICSAFSIAAFTANAVARSRSGKLLAVALFVLGVLSLHFTGVSVLTLIPDPSVAEPGVPLDRYGLAVTVALGAMVLLVVAAGFSLSDRRVAQAKMAAMKRMQRLADAALEGILFHDGRVILDANRQSAAMLGVEVDDMIGRPLTSFNKDGAAPDISEADRAKGEYRFEMIITGPRGDTPVEVHTRLFNAAEGVYVTAVRDISQQRRAETAEAENIAKSQYLANMSHELRTPLNAIIGYAELIAEESDEDNVRHDAGAIRNSARHLLSLINDILDLSRTESGKVELHIDDCDLSALLSECGATVQPAAKKNGVGLKVEVDPAIGRVAVDSLRLKQCVLNLMSNAVKFTHEGAVRLSARRAGAMLEIAVSDTGIGMTKEQMGRVFQAFAQADSSITRQYGGTGLGLAITERLVKLMSGSISVESAVGKGSTFCIRMPAAQARSEKLARVA